MTPDALYCMADALLLTRMNHDLHPGVYVNTVHRTATRNVSNTLRNVQPVHPNNRTRLVCSPFNRTREKTLSGVDLSPRLRNSRRIHMARFSGLGDHSGPISGHFRRFGDLGRTHYLRLQHWHSTLTLNIDIQHPHSTFTFNIGIEPWYSTLTINVGIQH